MSELSELINLGRGHCGLKQGEFAEILKISPQYMCDIEQGYRSITPELADKIHEAFTKWGDWYDGSEYSRKQMHQAVCRSRGWFV